MTTEARILDGTKRSRDVLNLVVACPTKVSFDIHSDGGLGGIETASIELARALARRGHRIVLATRTGRVREADGILNVPLEDTAGHPCDVVVSSNDATVFDRQGGRSGKVLWLHNPLSLEKAVRRSQMGAFLRHRPSAVFVSAVARRQMTSFFPFRSRHVIPHGVSAAFRETPVAGARHKRFIWASQRQRGLAPTLKAWTAFMAPEAAAEFHIFGTAAHEMGLTEETAARAGVVFHPRLPKAELARFYAEAFAMIYPGAHDETFCLAAAEAQAMGLPVLTLGIGALSERVQHGQNGLVCADYEALGASARRLLDDHELWELLHRGALAQREILTWDRAAKLWEEHLHMQSR